MQPNNRAALEERVVQACEAALADHGYVSAIDVLTGMRLLSPVHVESWRKGRIDFLERMIQGNLQKISLSMSLFREWAEQKGLRPSQTRYTRWGRGTQMDLRFSMSGDPDIERQYRTHFVSPTLSQRKLELKEKSDSAPRPVVFEILRDSECTECGVELPRGSMLFMDAEQPLCLACAGLGDLEYLPSGDTALTRRATKYSGTSAVVVRFSRTRGRYERQGILVEPAAIERAEAECTLDADDRAKARAQAAKLRSKQDAELVEQMTDHILTLFPRCPPQEARAIAAHTATRGSGRVGRSEAGRNLEPRALTAAVAAAIRHNHTNYDELLASGADRETARNRVGDTVQEILDRWQGAAELARQVHHGIAAEESPRD